MEKVVKKGEVYTSQQLSKKGLVHYKNTNCAAIFRKGNKVFWFEEKNKGNYKLLTLYESILK